MDSDEQDKNVKWLNSQKQGQHHTGCSIFGCGGPIKERWRCNSFDEHMCCYGSDIHNQNRFSDSVVVVCFNDAIFYSAIRHVRCDQSDNHGNTESQ